MFAPQVSAAIAVPRQKLQEERWRYKKGKGTVWTWQYCAPGRLRRANQQALMEESNRSSGSWLARGRRRRNVKFNPVGRVGLFSACRIQIADLVFVGRVLIEDPERLAGDSVT